MTQEPDSRGRVQHRTNARGDRFCNGCSNRNGFLPPDSFATVIKRGKPQPLAYCTRCEHIRAVIRVDARRQRMDEATRERYKRQQADSGRERRRRKREQCDRDARDALATLHRRGMTDAEITRRTGISDTTLRLIRTDPTHRPYPRTAHTLYRVAFGGAS